MSEWISVDERLPESNVPVLAYFKYSSTGKGRRIRAQYAAKKTLRAHEDYCEFGEYDEATDEYWSPPGWYETNEFDEVHYAVHEVVTHWMPLPEPPK